MERTFVMVKPDGVQRRHIGDIVSRIEKKGLRIVGMKLIQMSSKQAGTLYSVHKGRPFYDSLLKFVTASPAVVMVVEGYKAVSVVRKLLGATFGFDAEPGTIRGDFGLSKGYNLVHGSDAIESADREIPIFFDNKELCSYAHADEHWVNEDPERKS